MNSIRVERLEAYTPQDAAGIGLVMRRLSSRATGEPIDEQLLRTTIDSPLHDQFVARLDGDPRIIGAATISILLGPVAGKQAWLNDFVAEPEIGGIGRALWSAVGRRCIELEAYKLNFTSSNHRTAAHDFYKKRGCEIRDDTSVFLMNFDLDH